MALLLNESYARMKVPLWLPNRSTIESSSMGTFVQGSAIQVPANGSTGVVGSIVLSKNVNWVRLSGWLNLFTDSSSSTETITYSIYLSPSSTYTAANATEMTSITLTAVSGGHANYILLDGLSYYSSTSFDFLNLVVKMTSSHSNTDYIHPAPATGVAVYSSLPSYNPSNWTLTPGSLGVGEGTIGVMACSLN